jgi:hypothetical protein
MPPDPSVARYTAGTIWRLLHVRGFEAACDTLVKKFSGQSAFAHLGGFVLIAIHQPEANMLDLGRLLIHANYLNVFYRTVFCTADEDVANFWLGSVCDGAGSKPHHVCPGRIFQVYHTSVVCRLSGYREIHATAAAVGKVWLSCGNIMLTGRRHRWFVVTSRLDRRCTDKKGDPDTLDRRSFLRVARSRF